MNFNDFTIQKTSNGVVDTSLKEEVKLGHSKFSFFHPPNGMRVYQGCGKCGTETGHHLVGNTITCTICGNSYKVN